MEDKCLNDEELDKVSGGKSNAISFEFYFIQYNCMLCAKMDNGCPYKSSREKYEAFDGDPNAVCPDMVMI